MVCGALAGLCSMLLLMVAETLSLAAGGVDVAVPASHGDYCYPIADHAGRPVRRTVFEALVSHAAQPLAERVSTPVHRLRS